MEANATNHKFVTAITEGGADPLTEIVRKHVRQFDRGVITARELVMALGHFDPDTELGAEL